MLLLLECSPVLWLGGFPAAGRAVSSWPGRTMSWRCAGLPGFLPFPSPWPGMTLPHCQAVPGALGAVFQCHCFPQDPVLSRGQLSGSQSFQEGWAWHPFVCFFLEGPGEPLRCIFLLFFPFPSFFSGTIDPQPCGMLGERSPCAVRWEELPLSPSRAWAARLFSLLTPVLGSFPPHRPGLRNCSAVKLPRPP